MVWIKRCEQIAFGACWIHIERYLQLHRFNYSGHSPDSSLRVMMRAVISLLAVTGMLATNVAAAPRPYLATDGCSTGDGSGRSWGQGCLLFPSGSPQCSEAGKRSVSPHYPHGMLTPPVSVGSARRTTVAISTAMAGFFGVEISARQ